MVVLDLLLGVNTERWLSLSSSDDVIFLESRSNADCFFAVFSLPHGYDRSGAGIFRMVVIVGATDITLIR